MEQWLDLPPDERRPWLERGNLRASAALLLLEQAALRRHELLARDELKRRFLGRAAARNKAGADTLAALQDFLRLEGFLSRPAALLPETGYGLPQKEERDAVTQEGGRYAEQRRRQREQLRTGVRRWLPQPRQVALQAAEMNIDLLGKRLRELNRQQGGLQL